ncbi:hypothetical protein Btru_067897 [Bulinus truncatus]|nr:hypothetical protein Btru_067897 [Bulinus truncatus]
MSFAFSSLSACRLTGVTTCVLLVCCSVHSELDDRLCPTLSTCQLLLCSLRCHNGLSDAEVECLDCLCGPHHVCDCSRLGPAPPIRLTTYLSTRNCLIKPSCRSQCSLVAACPPGGQCTNGQLTDNVSACTSCGLHTHNCPAFSCSLSCANGFVLDSEGCPTCRCRCQISNPVCRLGKICSIDLHGCQSCVCGVGLSFPFFHRQLFLI